MMPYCPSLRERLADQASGIFEMTVYTTMGSLKENSAPAASVGGKCTLIQNILDLINR